MNKVKMVSFIAGFVTGGVVTGVTAGLYFKKKYQQLLSENGLNSDSEEELADKYIRKDLQEDLIEVANSRKTVNREVMENYESKKTDYRGMYQPKDSFAAGKNLVDAMEESDEDAEADLAENTSENDADDWHEKNKNRPPEIISADEAGELPSWVDSSVLFIYTDDDTVTDEDRNVIEDPERFLGNCIEDSQFLYTEEEQIFVLNYELDTLYDIQKVWGSYGE